MTDERSRQSATIYTFPARGRFAENDAAAIADAPTDPMMGPKPMAGAVISSGWYHDEAISEASAGRATKAR